MAGLEDVKKKDRFLIPEDVHLAKLYSVVHIGDQVTGFVVPETGEPAIRNQVHLTFEFQDVRIEDGRPAASSRAFTLSLDSRSGLHAVINALLGGGKLAEEKLSLLSAAELLKDTVGKSLMITVVHTPDGKYANMKGFSATPKALLGTVTPVENKIVFLPDVDKITDEDLKLLPQFLVKKITERENNDISDKLL